MLIKSTLASIPIYFLSLFSIPVSVANKTAKTYRNFLWGDTTEKKVISLSNKTKWGIRDQESEED